MAVVAVVACAILCAGAACGGGGAGDDDDPLAPDAAIGCGPQLEACIGTQVCRYEECVPAPPFCAAADGCEGDAWCDVAASECLPWGVGPAGDFDTGCAATDLTVHGVIATCSASGQANLRVDLCNRGSVAVAAGAEIAIYAGEPPGAALACVATAGSGLAPGVCTDASCAWTGAPGTAIALTVVVDDDGLGASALAECQEGNNTFELRGVACP